MSDGYDLLRELQSRTIAMQTASIKEAGAAIADAKVAILAQQSAIAAYERALGAVVANLKAANAQPNRAAQIIEDTIRLALSALAKEQSESDGNRSFGLPGALGMNLTADDMRRAANDNGAHHAPR